MRQQNLEHRPKNEGSAEVNADRRRCFLCDRTVAREERILRRHEARGRSQPIQLCRACDSDRGVLRRVDRLLAHRIDGVAP